MSDTRKGWERYCKYLCACPDAGVTLDISRMKFDDGLFAQADAALQDALAAMAELEGGAIANPDEQRMVGHYWLRAPELAPTAEIRAEIEQCLQRIQAFAADVHGGRIAPPGGGKFEHVLVIGIGGSALGPQFVDDALSGPANALRAWFFDNTDPDGFDRVLARIGDGLARTLVVVISKSGGTKETRNGMLEAQAAFRAAGLDFAKQAVAVTGEGSALHEVCRREGWRAAFPMWDWVGGRTSQTAAVGLLPAALEGFDIAALLAGAKAMDARTRRTEVRQNPAALLALMWWDAAQQRGLRDMVIIPYKDRLALFSRYLQQLVMESLGKEKDLDGAVVHQGIAVYGNKGSTDQHAYVQQLRDGLPNFHLTFIEVLADRSGPSIEVEPGVTSGDYLHGFLLGTRRALAEQGRESMTLTVEAVTPGTIGALIALYERAVGLYAGLVNINAYHQPGVEAGKRAAGRYIELQQGLQAALAGSAEARTADAWAEQIGAGDEAEWVYRILRRWAVDAGRGVICSGGDRPTDARFQSRR
ncbi:MAG TPA: glucose-6-phosphate isomerase [Phycisphaerae bacterium]|nr:glucose-6-phosphate isomerase [Phycisphaerae bacterium]